MTDQSSDDQKSEAGTKTEAANVPPAVVSSRDLLGDRRELVIQHGQEQYRLRLTNSNKLILIK